MAQGGLFDGSFSPLEPPSCTCLHPTIGSQTPQSRSLVSAPRHLLPGPTPALKAPHTTHPYLPYQRSPNPASPPASLGEQCGVAAHSRGRHPARRAALPAGGARASGSYKGRHSALTATAAASAARPPASTTACPSHGSTEGAGVPLRGDAPHPLPAASPGAG